MCTRHFTAGLKAVRSKLHGLDYLLPVNSCGLYLLWQKINWKERHRHRTTKIIEIIFSKMSFGKMTQPLYPPSIVYHELTLDGISFISN